MKRFDPTRENPRNILLVKSHSAGVGDILRSSAAWAVLHRRWPEARLHLLFLTRWPGYPSEELVRDHFLLESAHFIPLREGKFAGMRGVGPGEWKKIFAALGEIAGRIRPELIIDHEPHGLESTIVSRYLRSRSSGSVTVGVAEVPGRGKLYDFAGPSLRRYARERSLPEPMDYTCRDFAALAALGLERNGQPIVLQVGGEGQAWQSGPGKKISGNLRIGLNIGCGTPDAHERRPDINMLVDALGKFRQTHPFTLLLTGAANEQQINREFILGAAERWGDVSGIFDLSGTGSLNTLAGIISHCHLFISGDSGPYHMAVALGIPTLAIFNLFMPEAFHKVPYVRICLSPDTETVMAKIEELLPHGP